MAAFVCRSQFYLVGDHRFLAVAIIEDDLDCRNPIDVGTGTNLYPALAMLPLVESITLGEHSQANPDLAANP